jgi:hypothetical protein
VQTTLDAALPLTALSDIAELYAARLLVTFVCWSDDRLMSTTSCELLIGAMVLLLRVISSASSTVTLKGEPKT